jgi:Holliday junction DNA helicase RuvA
MIAHLQGKLVETPTHVIIDCGGIGYHVNILHTYSLLPNGDFIKLFTHLQIKKMHILYLDLLKSQKRDF